MYVLDSEGAAREGWPVQMGDVQGQVAVADIDSDGRMCPPCHPSLRKGPDFVSVLHAIATPNQRVSDTVPAHSARIQPSI